MQLPTMLLLFGKYEKGEKSQNGKFGHQVAHWLELPYWHRKFDLTWYLHQPEFDKLSINKDY